MLKRMIDLCASAAGLLALAPVFLVIAGCIRYDSPGPVFFRQERIGRGGRPFRIYKFRTMTTRPAGDLSLTVGEDSRITPIGTILRRYRIDELPQLLNVLKGDMSLIGPRPEVPEYVAHYPERDRKEVLGLRPGITGLASVLYHAKEETRLAAAEDPEAEYLGHVLPAKLRLERFYVRHQHLGLDAMLLWWTLGAMIRK